MSDEGWKIKAGFRRVIIRPVAALGNQLRNTVYSISF
jgi:hypothetical protein